MPLSGTDFDYLKRLARERSGIVLVEGDARRVEARLALVAKASSLASVDALVARLRAQGSGALHAQAVEAMTANASPFLLDGRAAEIMSTRILPQLASRRGARRRLRFWCPACGGGQEPYSIALLIRERFSELADWDLTILASDPSPENLEKAVSGSYSLVEAVHGLPTSVLVKHFVNQGTHWQLKDDIRAMVRFTELNLRAEWPDLETMDAVFMRNVLVYFGPAIRKPLLARLRTVLAPDGYLFLGSADAAMLLDGRFERMQDEKSGFYQPVA